MKNKIDKKYVQIGLMLFFTAIAIMLVFFFFSRQKEVRSALTKINTIFAPIIYGLIMAYLMTPLLNFIEKKLIKPAFNKFKLYSKSPEKKRFKAIRTCSVTLTIIIVFLLLYLFFVAVIPDLYKSIQSLVSHYSIYKNNLIKWINKVVKANPELAEMVSQMLYNYLDETDNWLKDIILPAISDMFPNINKFIFELSSSIIKFGKLLWNLVIGIIISLYVLASKEKFIQSCTKILYAFFENKSANKFLEAVRFTHRKFIGFLSGKVVDSVIIGLICFIICKLLDMPYCLLVSLIIGVTNIIPFFGPWFGAIPSFIIILMVKPEKALIFIIFVLILQQFDGNILGPKILSESTGISSFWIICSITIFGGLFGVLGMIIGVPVTAVLFAGANTLTDRKLLKKSLPIEEEAYYNVGNISPEGEFTEYVYQPAPKKKPGKLFLKLQNLLKKIFDKILTRKKTNREEQ